MMKNIVFILLILAFACDTEKENDYSSYDTVMTLKSVNDNALADDNENVTVEADFSSDFITEDDGKVDFHIYKDGVESIVQSEIRITENIGMSKKIAEVFIKHNRSEAVTVKGVISIGGVEISKNIVINFQRALPQNINVFPSTVSIAANNFGLIQVTTELSRTNGIVTLGTMAETEVRDTLGNLQGLFNNYKNIIDDSGKIQNNFTLGSSNYIGKLYIISKTLNPQNQFIKDTAVIYSHN